MKDFSLNGSRFNMLSAPRRCTVEPRSSRSWPGANVNEGVEVLGCGGGGSESCFRVLIVRSNATSIPRSEKTSLLNEKISRTLRLLNLMLPQMPKCDLI